MILVYDTNILIDLSRNVPETTRIIQSLQKQYPAPAHITIVTYTEFLIGIIERRRNQQQLLINTTRITGNVMAALTYSYARKGKILSYADLLIASLIIENEMMLVTKDADFNHIEELKKIVV